MSTSQLILKFSSTSLAWTPAFVSRKNKDTLHHCKGTFLKAVSCWQWMQLLAHRLSSLSWYVTFLIYPLNFLKQFKMMLKAMIIIAKQSFWMKKAFTHSMMDAFYQFQKQGHAEKLKTLISPSIQSLPSSPEGLFAFLYGHIIHFWWYVYYLTYHSYISMTLIFGTVHQHLYISISTKHVG